MVIETKVVVDVAHAVFVVAVDVVDEDVVVLDALADDDNAPDVNGVVAADFGVVADAAVDVVIVIVVVNDYGVAISFD